MTTDHWPRFTFQEPDIVSVYRDATDHGLFWSDWHGRPARGMFPYAAALEHEKPITHEDAIQRQPKVAQMFPLLD